MRSRATYRIRGIHESFDRASLENALCSHFGTEKDGFTIHSLAYDAPYGRSSRQKVATITFQITPELLKEGSRWQARIPHLQGVSEELCTISIDTTFDGFTPLTADENEYNTDIDCILIHGWAGHSIGSFSSPDGDWFWPRDSLSDEIPHLRVWLYGYSSDLRDGRSITDVYEYADTFKRALTDARKSPDLKLASRPLIFIVHSLGGFILQDTINRMAASSHADDKTNLGMVKGALLFGVPNQGMESQQLMNLLQEDDLPALYTASLLDDKYGFRHRTNRVHDFYEACNRNNAIVCTFYETEKTPTVCRDAKTKHWTRTGPAALLVSQASATYACPKQRNMISWKSGHNDMLKLRRDDTQYETLLSRLREIIQGIGRTQTDQEKPSPASDMQLKSSINKYQLPFSIRGLPVTRKFIDRPTEMQSLREALLPKSTDGRRKTFVLRGLGGIGKTQLAIEFIRLYHAEFSCVFWLDGSSEDSLKQSLVQHASRIEPGQISEASRTYARSSEGDIDVVVREILDWLDFTGNNTWLLVFDNVDREFDPSKPDSLAYDIEQYLPDADHGSILITTRLAQMEQLGESQEVKRVGNDTAQAILRSWYKESCDEVDVKKLLNHLDGLPLAIAQAGAYLLESGINVKTYLRLYEDVRNNIDETMHDSHVLKDYPNRSVWTTWTISYDSIQVRDEHAAHLLILWSFLNRVDFYYGLFEKAITQTLPTGAFSQWLGSIANQESFFRKAMHLLRRYSLIENSMETDGYSMHAVVHRWVYFYLGLKHQEDLGVLALTLVGFAVPDFDEREYASLEQRLLPHAQTCTSRALVSQTGIRRRSDFQNHSADWANQQKNILFAMKSLGTLYYHQDKLAKAELMYERTRSGIEILFGADNEITLVIIGDLAMVYFAQGKLAEAEKLHEQVLSGSETALREDSSLTLRNANNLGNIYLIQGKLAEAEKMYERALEGSDGEEHTSRANNNLGLVYAAQGKLAEAEKAYGRALSGSEKAFGAEHILTLYTVNNLGTLYGDQGKLADAEQMYERALNGREKAVGAEHTSTLDTVNNLGNLYLKQGRLAEAEKMYGRALNGKERTLGAEHISTLDTVNNLGLLYALQGKLAKAELMHERALKGYEKAVGTESVKTYVPALNTMWGFGDLYRTSRPDEARVMYEKALSGFTKVRGPSADVCIDLIQCLEELEMAGPSTQRPVDSRSNVILEEANCIEEHQPETKPSRWRKLKQKMLR